MAWMRGWPQPKAVVGEVDADGVVPAAVGALGFVVEEADSDIVVVVPVTAGALGAGFGGARGAGRGAESSADSAAGGLRDKRAQD